MRAAASLALVLLAAGCGSKQQQSEAIVAPGFECATDGASDYGTGCTLERASAKEGAILTLRSPTGSFRRLRIVGGNISAADGAEPARIIGGDAKRIDVAVGDDRYRIPRDLLQ